MLLVRLPVELYQMGYIENGNRINLQVNSGRLTYEAKVIEVDNTVQFIDQRQNVFITALVEKSTEMFIPNMLVEAEIECGDLSALNFMKRIFKIVFAN
jgi:hypothetical protein